VLQYPAAVLCRLAALLHHPAAVLGRPAAVLRHQVRERT